METKIFNKFRSLIYELSGIALNDKKEALVSARINKRMRSLNFEKHIDYLNYISDPKNAHELIHLLDAITTNVTQFFREPKHFDILRNALALWYTNGQRKFRLWSAGCSSGEEPYSIAMTLLENLKGAETNCKILASDISTQILSRSLDGRYNQEKFDQVPKTLGDKYFDVCDGDNKSAKLYKIKDSVKSLIVFKRINLVDIPFPMRGPFDTIFCRNVMIYFDNQVRSAILNEFSRLLKVGGYLLVGHAESLIGLLSNFKTVAPSVYVKCDG